MKTRIIGIDASRYGGEEATGVEWYSFHLLNELIPMLGREHNYTFKLYAPSDFIVKTDIPFNVKKRIIPAKKFWTLVRLSFEMLIHPVDALFIPSHTLPLIFPKKSIITIHDTAFRHFKEFYSRLEYFILNRSTKKAVKKAWKIIVPSKATKKDLIEYFNCNADKIHVIPHGSPEIPKLLTWTDKETNYILDKFGLKRDDLYVFYVGRIETKKNLGRLVEGFSRFLKEFPDWKLILAGKHGIGHNDILNKVYELGLKDNVFMPGYITEKEKLFLMSGCRIFAFPSLYEGFGLPILEAFALRRPVLTSKTSAMAEVAENAAHLVDPTSVEEIGIGLKRLASDGFYVNGLIVKGEQQLKKFSWETSAQKTFDTILGLS